jgi:4'-phosphopantetheinyl transferase EntD
MGVIGELLPPVVRWVESYQDIPEPALFPAEAAQVAGAVDKRQREYATVRHCARQALAQLGFPPVPLPRGERGAPQWPAGVVGSLTHCDGYRAAVVARAEELTSLGIDAEPHAALPEGVLPLVARPEERQQLTELAATRPDVCWDRLLFSAKEAVYKAWYPLARRFLDFPEASVHLVDDGRFTVRLLVPGPQLPDGELTTMTGRWLTGNGLVLAAVTVPGY